MPNRQKMKTFNKKLGDMKSKLYSIQRELFEMMGSDKYDLTTNSIKIDKESSKFNCIKNRWNIPANYDMKFGNDGIIRDV